MQPDVIRCSLGTSPLFQSGSRALARSPVRNQTKCRSCCMAKNIVSLLYNRQLRWCGGRELEQAATCLTPSRISLAQIMDRDRALLRGHVILGFSRSGDHMISYQCELDGSTSEHCYSLHWWAFNLHRPLTHVWRGQLFRGELLVRELHLLVCQTLDESCLVVVGCRKLWADDRRPCYVTVFPSPLQALSDHTTPADSISLHFKYDLLPPFPAFTPSLSLRIPGCIILNTGDSLVFLSYRVSSGDATTPPNEESTQTRQVFALPSPFRTASPVLSPSHLLPVDVYWGDQPLADITRESEKPGVSVALSQSSLDVELWLSGALQSELELLGFTFHSLTDYDLQLVEVCAERGDVVFLVVVMLEASGHSPSISESYSIEITGSWNAHSGHARALRVSSLQPVPPLLNQGSHGQWNPAASLALALRREWHVPPSPQHTIRAFSNHTVFTGKSLHSLHHPYLPVQVVLVTSRTATPHSAD